MQSGMMIEEIKELIQDAKYELALEAIENNLDLSGEHIKELIDLKGIIFIKQKEFEKVVELYKDTMIYEMISKKDIQSFENLSIAYEELGKSLYSKAMLFQSKMLEKNKKDVKEYIQATAKKNVKLQEKILVDSKNTKLYYELAYNHILQIQPVEACIYHKLYSKYIDGGDEVKDEVSEFINTYQYVNRFYEQLSDERQTYCLIANKDYKDDLNKYNVLAQALVELGHQVYIVMPAVNRKGMAGDFNRETLTKESLNGLTFKNQIGYIYPIQVMKEDKVIYNNTEDLIMEINNVYCKEDSWIVLGDREYLKTLTSNIEIFKIMQKGYIENTPRIWPTLSVMYMGNYLYTAKRMYRFDVPTWMKEEPEVKVSIVIPTRNCSYTLKDTLRTCLEQSSDEYEIVISDNSSSDYMETYNLIQEINNPKIKYYRTPYALSLAKSFEYAYLRTKGEFIFSIGSDDGVLPYTVKHLCKILEDFPNDNVFAWSRLGYTWPELKVTGLADSFAYPALIVKEPVTTHRLNSDAHMTRVIDYLNRKYAAIYDAMPTGYINAGMRRVHLFEMIRATGKILDGYSQDIYTAVLNFALCESILYIDYPLATAGLCNRSVGLTSVAINKGVDKYKQLISEYNWCVETTDIPGTPSQAMLYPQYDYLLFAYEVLKVADLNINSKCAKWKEKMDLKNLLEWGIWQDSIQRSIYQDFVEIGKQCAAKQGEAVSQWFNQLAAIYESQPEPESVEPDTSKRYSKGLASNNWVTIDGSEFGLSNIYDVTQFFVKLYNL